MNEILLAVAGAAGFSVVLSIGYRIFRNGSSDFPISNKNKAEDAMKIKAMQFRHGAADSDILMSR